VPLAFAGEPGLESRPALIPVESAPVSEVETVSPSDEGVLVTVPVPLTVQLKTEIASPQPPEPLLPLQEEAPRIKSLSELYEQPLNTRSEPYVPWNAPKSPWMPIPQSLTQAAPEQVPAPQQVVTMNCCIPCQPCCAGFNVGNLIGCVTSSANNIICGTLQGIKGIFCGPCYPCYPCPCP